MCHPCQLCNDGKVHDIILAFNKGTEKIRKDENLYLVLNILNIYKVDKCEDLQTYSILYMVNFCVFKPNIC